MKIVIFIKSSPGLGGLETQNQLLLEGLRKQGHQVEIIKTNSPFGDSLPKKVEADVVISQSAAGTRFLLSRRSRKPPVVVIQHGTLLGSLKTRLRMEGFSLRLVPYAIKAYFLDQIRLRRAAAIIAVSKQVRRALIREYFLPPEKIKVVYNGIEVSKLKVKSEKSKIERKEELGFSKKDRIVLYLGRLTKEKGLDVLLEAFRKASRLPNYQTAKLLIVGDGPCFNDLNHRSRGLGLEGMVRFVGRVPHKEVLKYYQAADVFVLPSIADEGLPMTVIEAMAVGLPIVASRIGGIPEAVADGKTGLLVKPGDIEELETALVKLLADEDLRLRMGEKARQVAKAKFNQEAMVGKTLKVLKEVRQ